MKKHTRFLALLLTAIMRLSLAACGGNSDTPPSGGDTPNTDTSTPSETKRRSRTRETCRDSWDWKRTIRR